MVRNAVWAWVLVAGLVTTVGACTGRDRSGDSGGSGGNGSTSSGGSSGFVGPRPGATGSACARNAECDSQLCLESGRCTESCADTASCPESWTCGALPGAGRLCQCSVTTSGGTELCDGQDNNCNATVDENATCEDGKICQGGQCVCPPDRACNGQCVNLDTDNAHCGRCGNACGANRTCVGGSCVLDCGAQTACNDTCVDTQTNGSHCGMCGRSCGATGTCSGGNCQCGGGTTLCDGACVTVSNNPSHCGMCGRACNPGGTCNNGTCMDAPVTLCTNTCQYAMDGECDDGGTGSLFTACDYGTDCADCGARMGSGSSSSGGSSGTPRAMGEPCTANSECADGTCITQLRDGWVGGYCTRPCNNNQGDPCGANGYCGEDGVCEKRCTSQSQCREGYRCIDPAVSGTQRCMPYADGTGAVGAPCTTFRDCQGGTLGYCLTEARGWPGGYCSQFCMRGNIECGSGHCVQEPDGSGFLAPGACAADCTTDGQCRSMYTCQAANGDAEKECFP